MIFDVNIISITEHLIHHKVQHRGNRMVFAVTIVYGFNDATLRKSLWEEIKKINEQMRGPWAVMGDFNCVLNRR